MRHLLSLWDLTSEEIHEIIALSQSLKEKMSRGIREPLLERTVIGLIFEKPSLRTRVSFETGIRHLGGSALFLTDEAGWGKREPLNDFANVLSRFVDIIVCRAKSHETIEVLAQHSRCPVINGLTDLYHPCQALADVLTVKERFADLQNRKIAYVGDCNNVARSLVIACGRIGVPISIACPPAYRFEASFDKLVQERLPAIQYEITDDPSSAVSDACAVYTDVWASMGQESEQGQREKDFEAYQVNQELMSQADPQAIFLHCLPAHRGLEVSAEVIDGPQSAVYEQAENRLHAQKGLMAWLSGVR